VSMLLLPLMLRTQPVGAQHPDEVNDLQRTTTNTH
jgi:hypothetical protein